MANRHFARFLLEELEARCLPSGFDPMAAEQMFLEALNDARANPAAYGASIGVDLSGIAPAPPLAFDPRLIQAARLHSQDMNARAFFDHVNPDGVDVPGRLNAAQFPWTSWGESLAGSPAWSQPGDALKALIIDKGVADLGHRKQLLGMGPPYVGQTEVGVGIVQGGSGPLTNYYTVDTADPADGRPCLTGVVFEDANGNGRYDPGEGIGGAALDVAGIGTFASFASGGYTIQLSPGTYTVTAHGGGLRRPITQTVTLGAANLRVNFADLPQNPVLFTATADGALYRHDDGSGWSVIGARGTIRSISTVTNASGLVVVFAVTTDRALFRYDDRNGWAQLGGAGTIAAASAGTDAAGRASVLVQTTAGHLFAFGPATGWAGLGEPAPVQAFTAAGNGRAFVITADQSVFSYGPAWGWSRLTAPGFASSITATTEASGAITIFVVTLDGALYRYGDQAGWLRIGDSGTIRSASAGTDASGHANVFAVTSKGELYLYTAWSGWQMLAPGGYSAIVPAAYDMVFAAAADGSLYEHNDLYGWFRLTGPAFARVTV